MAAGRGKSGGDDNRRAEVPSPSNANHAEFVSEAEEILERMFEDLGALHEASQRDGDVDPDLINRIFRSAHSLKGVAGMFGVGSVSDLAHRLEDILDRLRLGRTSINASVIVLLDDGIALLASLMKSLGQGGETQVDSETSAAVAAFISQLETAARTPVEDPVEDLEGLGIDANLLRALTEYEEHRLRESLRRGRSISLIETAFEIATFEEGLSEIAEAVREVGEMISTLPSPGGAPASQIRFSLLIATDISATDVAARVQIPEGNVKAIVRGQVASSPRVDSSASRVSVVAASALDPNDDDLALPKGIIGGETRGPSPEAAAPGSVNPTDPASAPEPANPSSTRKESSEQASLRSLSETVRVDIRKLDELMNLVGELAIQRNAIGEVVGKLARDPETARISVELGKAHLVLARKLKELQAGVLDVRMVPMRQIYEKLSRVVRRLQRDLDKEVEIDFSGSDTELDKLIVEELVDPLVHLVRNAFDHAIEPAAEREGAGKDPRGKIFVRAMQRGNRVVVEVEDDGRGMDSSLIFVKAVERGLVADSDVLSERELLGLVFEPGFSTREQVTETSGRGVGMDVVKSNLAAMGGSVELASRLGHGTTVTITLPITLAIMQALIVEVGPEQFAIPLGSVLETLVVEPAEIDRSEDREILDLRGEPLRLRRLSDELELVSAGRDVRQFVVVLGMGDQRLGLLVDRLVGQQDAIIKPIKGPIQQIRGIAGAAELGSANAILVIDVASIIDDPGRRREAA